MAVFPAAAPSQAAGHPATCPCPPCTERLLTVIRRPLVQPVPRVDPALDRRRAKSKES
ncbi:hypothetical protein M3G91_23560 [Micromonospora chalcea]|uniref:hypothetical protein n=1 Tax=Micromonospora chalcea TaxID=1874 RepID=UPI0021A5BD7A|nr:hypothetical protein [Micromonospora chalcea]MCT2280597.1 hypothetical protein [Micromonospora chalcea]